MINGKIEVSCPYCDCDMVCEFDDYAEPWNESPVLTARCECGTEMRFYITADEPVKAKEETR